MGRRPKPVVDGTAECSKCHEWKPLAEFHKRRVGAIGVASRCKECTRKPGATKYRPCLTRGDEKFCHHCESWKNLIDFEKNKNCRNGRGSRCKECSLRRTNDMLSRSPERFMRDLARLSVSNLKTRAKSRGKAKRHLWDDSCITYEFLRELYERQDGRCAITGLKMTYQRGSRKAYRNISIDRIDSDKGYVRGNVQLVCKIVNLMKSEMDQSELEFWCLAILEGSSGHSNPVKKPIPKEHS